MNINQSTQLLADAFIATLSLMSTGIGVLVWGEIKDLKYRVSRIENLYIKGD